MVKSEIDAPKQIYKEITIQIPKQFDVEGFARFLKMDRKEFWKTAIRGAVEGFLSREDEDDVEKLIDVYGLAEVLEAGSAEEKEECAACGQMKPAKYYLITYEQAGRPECWFEFFCSALCLKAATSKI